MARRLRSEVEAAPGRELVPPVWVVSYPEPLRYAPMLERQRELRELRAKGAVPDLLLLLEHEPVVTLGKNAKREHLLFSGEQFQARAVDLHETDRGGDVTYHGPGQLVGYWIFDLKALYQDIHRYLRTIEEVLIDTLDQFGIAGGRAAGRTGVWVGERKVAAMGLHLNHWVSTHGFALNVSNDLAPFSWIVPCGLHGFGVTSMAELLPSAPSRPEVESALVDALGRHFDRRIERKTPLELTEACGAGLAGVAS